MKNNSEIMEKAATPGRQPSRLLPQTTGAVLLSALFFLPLILVHRPFPAGFAYPEQSASRWALYVCGLLTFWSLAGLFVDWWRARRRARSIAGTSIPPSASLASEEGVREVIGAVRAAAARYGDSLLAGRIENAIARFQSSNSAAAAAEELAMAGDAALADVEASHTSVRLFLYAIPILGFAGTVMCIRQTLERAALSPSAPQQLDAIRAALARITSNLAGSFDPALVAVVLSLVVMVALSWVIEKEKRLLLAIDNFCHTHLLPLMQPAAPDPASAPAAREEALIGVLTDLRSVLDGITRNGNGHSLEPVEAQHQLAAALERLRNDLGDGSLQHSEPGKAYLEQRQARSPDLAGRFNELPEGRGEPRENRVSPLQPVFAGRLAEQISVPLNGRPSDAASPAAAHVEDLSAALEDLCDSIREMDSFLQRLSQRLRSQSGEPVVVKVKMMPMASPSASLPA